MGWHISLQGFPLGTMNFTRAKIIFYKGYPLGYVAATWSELFYRWYLLGTTAATWDATLFYKGFPFGSISATCADRNVWKGFPLGAVDSTRVEKFIWEPPIGYVADTCHKLFFRGTPVGDIYVTWADTNVWKGSIPAEINFCSGLPLWLVGNTLSGI